MSRATMHPTKAILVETVVEMLETIKPGDIQADKVLEISGISKGSLYHHFEDLGELVETAQKDLNPRALAVFIQSYTLGKMVDDFSPNRVSEDDWNSLIDGIVNNYFTNHSSQ